MKIILVSLANHEALFLEFGKILRGDSGLSAYEVWLQDGNSGSLADYFRFLQQPAIQAASEVIEAEEERQAAETARQQAETLRSGAETNRRNAEAIRASSEEGRLGKEDERVAAERLRVYYEDARRYEEGRRDVAEQYREAQRQAANTAESTRASNETIRIENEDTRKENETTRQENEAIRQRNETGRLNAEADRIVNVDSLISGSAIALADAQEANRIANDANTLAGETIQAAQEATEEALVLVNRVSDLEVTRIDGAFAENGLLYLTIGGVPIGSGIEVGSGTGGGGGVSTDTTVLIRLTSGFSSTFAAAHGSEAMLHYTFSSVYNSDQAPTGDGSAVYFVNGVQVAAQSIAQGDRTFNVGPYLNAGSNRVSVVVSDALGSGRTLQYSITAVVLSISSNFNAAIAHDTAINFKYTPIGSINKTVCFDIDGERIATFETLLTGRELTQVIPAQTHGAHLFEVYIETEIGGVIATSNVLRYDIICLEAGNNTPIIASAYNTTEAMQYGTINIPYIVYTPNLIESTIDLKINDVVLSSLVVDRTQQTWSYRANLQQPLTMEIVCGAVSKSFTISIEGSIVDAQAVSADLDLFLTSAGRSNNEINKDVWEFGDIQAQFNGFTWVTDGWIMDDDGNIAMRVQNDARLYIPFNIFGTDFRAYGKTIEIEFAIRNVNDFYTTAISCLYNNRGFNVDVQSATLRSEQSSVSTKFKENERVRVSYVVESRYANRLILIYINGVLSGAAQYPQEDNFMQAVPTGISIGSNGCTTDIYNIRVYNNDLNSFELLENYVADMDDIERKLYLFNRNNIYDEYGNIVYERVLQQLPCMILKGTLPTFKGDKKPIDVVYEDAQVPGNSFTYTSGANLDIDVQGTSSQYYPRKNYKLKTKKGTFIQNGVTVASGLYKLRENSIPANVFCFKADFAEASGTHNTGLAKLTDDILRAIGVLTPPQRNEDPAMPVRTSVDGFPIVIFHQETSESPVTFLGKYNFNIDKGAVDSYGFTDEDITESWEFCNNTSPRCLFRSDDFTGDEWMNDFEARFPDLDEPFDDTTNLQVLFSWILSLDPSGATGDALAAPVTYEGVEYTNDTSEYRVAKFKDEAEEHFNLQNILSYYLITELFGMTDQRAKNQFLTSWGNEGSGAYKWYMIFYDNDTALGINNEGLNIFGYDIEYHDSAVWNGESSLLWELVELAFFDDILSLYQDMRTQNIVSYELAFNYLNEEQSEKWAEAIYNADGKYKYIDPGIEQNNWTYLYAAQGSRAEHRKWWLFNRFRYMDSKYTAGDYQSDFATMRLYTPSGELAVPVNHNFVITPFADQYTRVKFGSYLVGGRSYANTPITIEAPQMTFNDTETIIYGASRITSFGSLADKYAGTVDLSAATNLTEIIIGSSVEGYDNPYLHSLYVGNSSMLKKLDIQNCSGLTQAVDLSHCENIEEVYAQGTNITAVLLPAAGNLKKLYLPGSIANLSLRNQPQLTDEYFSIESVELLNTIRIESVPNLNVLSLIQQCLALEDVVLERVRITGINWETEWATTIAPLQSLSTIGGLDENGNNTPSAVLTGDITLTDTATPAEYVERVEYMEAAFPNVNLHFAHKARLFTFSLEDSAVQTNPYIVFDGSEEVFYFADYPEGLIYYSSDAISGIISADGSPEVSFSYDAITEDVAHNIYIKRARKRTFNLTVTGGGIPINGYVDFALPTGTVRVDADEYGQVVIYQENAVDAVIGADNGETYPLTLGAIVADRTYDITLNILYTVEFVIRDIDDEIIEGAYISITGESEPRYADETGSVMYYTKLAYAGNVGADGLITMPFSYTAPSSNRSHRHTLLVDEVIQFADINVESICLSNWDTDNDGLLYVHDIINVTTIGSIFKGNTNIVSFNEFRFFMGVTVNLSDTFEGCSNLQSIIIPNSVTSFNRNVFRYCYKLTSVTLPNKLVNTGYGLFDNCRALQTVAIPDSVTTIGTGLFDGCYLLQGYALPARFTIIPNYTFRDCRAFQNIVIPDGVTSIGGQAFKGCTSLTSITIPDRVTSIGDGAFWSCTNLTSITLPEGLTSIGSSVFWFCSNLTSITLPERVTSIGSSAFNSCAKLTSITIPDRVTSIGSAAFSGCTNLTSITLPEGLTSIGSSVFWFCSNLTSITLPERVTSIGSSAFNSCAKLTSITIPDRVTSIGDGAFNGCSSLTSIVMLPITPPTLGGAIGTVISGSEKIFVPAISTHAYMVATNWASNKDQMVGQEAFLSGATLPDYSGATYTTCTWYSDSACTTTVSGSTAPSDGTYYCKLTA